MNQSNTLIDINIINKKIDQPFTYMVDLSLYNLIKIGDIVLVEFNNRFEIGIVENIKTIKLATEKIKYKKIEKILERNSLTAYAKGIINYLTNELYVRKNDIYNMVLNKNRIKNFSLSFFLSNKWINGIQENRKLKDINLISTEIEFINKYFSNIILVKDQKIIFNKKIEENNIQEIKYSKLISEEKKIIKNLFLNKIIDFKLSSNKISYKYVYKFSPNILDAPEEIKLLQDSIEWDKYLNKKEFLKKYNLSEYKFQKLKKLEKIKIKRILKGDEYKFKDYSQKKIKLNIDQEKALLEITQKEDKIKLLHGVTGSGKTAIYIKLIEKVISQNKQILILVPEVTLTLQMTQEIESYFPKDCTFFHNSLSKSELEFLLYKVKSNEIKIIIGTRSSIFLDIPYLDYVIVDEEHDNSYKQNVYPYYHINNLYNYWIEKGIKILLSSATPSILSYTKAIKNKYKLITLSKRYNNSKLPEIEFLKESNEFNNHFKLDNILINKILERIQNKENVLILFNVKGYSKNLECLNCGYVPTCPNCQISLKYYRQNKNLKCSFCDYEEKFMGKCTNCASTNLKYIGVGIEQVEEELQKRLPNEVLRLDATVAKKKKESQMIINKFKKETGLILLGTQILSKGLNFPNLNYVVVLNIDSMLFFSDFRANESTYQLLEQISGRSGRFGNQGKVTIVTNHQENSIFKAVKNHNYKEYYKYEMENRHLTKTVPYYYIAMIELRHKYQEIVSKKILEVYNSIDKNKYIVSQINTPYIQKLENKYRQKIYIKYKNRDLKKYLEKILQKLEKEGIDVLVDLEIISYGY